MINRSKKNKSRVHLNLIEKRRKRWKKIERSIRQREKREREKKIEKKQSEGVRNQGREREAK